jgi:hypothetical protein
MRQTGWKGYRQNPATSIAKGKRPEKPALFNMTAAGPPK